MMPQIKIKYIFSVFDFIIWWERCENKNTAGTHDTSLRNEIEYYWCSRLNLERPMWSGLIVVSGFETSVGVHWELIELEVVRC